MLSTAPPRATSTVQAHSIGPRDRAVPDKAARVLLELVSAARAGDDRAWNQLHARFTPMLRSIAYSYRLSSSDVDDAVQMTWVRLVNHIGRLRDPAAVAGWLATTTRRECLRLLQRPVRERVTDDPRLGDRVDQGSNPELELLAAERRAVLASALETLPERHRQLMILLLAQPKLDYETISETLGMPRGSIGPIRARSIARLQGHPELCAIIPGATC